jgi:hypothetical protein
MLITTNMPHRESELAGVREDDRGIAGEIFVQGNAVMWLSQQAGESGFAILDRQPAQIPPRQRPQSLRQ